MWQATDVEYSLDLLQVMSMVRGLDIVSSTGEEIGIKELLLMLADHSSDISVEGV
jgi:hypothetical protein